MLNENALQTIGNIIDRPLEGPAENAIFEYAHLRDSLGTMDLGSY